MGDVVLSLVLKDKGLLEPPEDYLPRPHVFVISSGHKSESVDADAMLPKLVADLRSRGFHVRHSYKTTKNIGKLLGEAARTRAHAAVILGRELDDPRKLIALKNLDSGEQVDIPLNEIESRVRALLAAMSPG
jgi:histidyl-tRNA synthetase